MNKEKEEKVKKKEKEEEEVEEMIHHPHHIASDILFTYRKSVDCRVGGTQ